MSRKISKNIIYFLAVLSFLCLFALFVLAACGPPFENITGNTCVTCPDGSKDCWITVNAYGCYGCNTYPPPSGQSNRLRCTNCSDGSQACTHQCLSWTSAQDLANCGLNGCCVTWTLSSGACGGGPGPGPACGCDLQNLTCPATCQRNTTFDITYETKSTLASGCYVYQALLGHLPPAFSWANELWCDDDIYYGNTNWNLQTKTIDCNDIINTAANNLKIKCYGDDDDIYAGGQWCDDNCGEPAGCGEDWLWCKIDGLCAADDIASCCNGSGIFDMPDANSTAGAVPGSGACQGANFNSCWAPVGGFGFPDVQNGELYNDNCCGDDSQEYFVSDFGVFQAGSQLSSQDRSCDGTIACCRHSGAGIYPGYVLAGQCVASCGPASVGSIRVMGPSGVIELNLISVADGLAKVPFPGMVKVMTPSGPAAADLVATTDANASPVRLRTPVGVYSWAAKP